MTLEHRKFRRVHGLQFPLHPQQVIGWIVILIIVVNTFAILTPLLKPNLRSVFSIVIAIIFFIHICSHLAVILLDPADPRVRSQPTNKIVPEFDRNKHSHVIENGRCHLCNITIESKRTKHCSICNKCIIRFDHHCKWLNNCIGARNYCAFLICLISAILASLFVTGLSVTELSLLLFFDRIIDQPATNITTKNATDSVVLFIVPISDTTIIIAISAIGILSAIVAILLLHLCFFHGYIACLGLTTYEYIRNKREKKSVATTIATTDTTAAATTTTSITTKITSIEIITTTVTGNSSSIPVQQIESRIQHGFCEFVSARRFLLSSFANGENQCFCCDINDNRIKLERKSNQIVTQSSFFYGESKEKNFQFCFSIHDIFESQSKQTPTENSTDVSSANIEQPTITFRKWNTTLSTSIFCCSTSLNSIAMYCTKNIKMNISKKQSCDKQSCDVISNQIAYVSTNSYKNVERIGFFYTYLNKEEKRKRCRKKRKSQEQSYDMNIVHIQKLKKINKIDLITKEDYDSFMKNIVLLISITASSLIIPFYTLIIIVPLYSKLPPLYKSSITKLDLSESQNQISLRLQKITGSSTYRFGTCFIFQKGQTTKSYILSIKLSSILESEFSKPATSQSHSSLSSYSEYFSCLLISLSFASQSFSSPRVIDDKFYLHEKYNTYIN